MSWDYRVVKTYGRTPKRFGGRRWTRYAIHEVYYDAKGKPDGYTMEPTWPQGSSKTEFRRNLSQFLRDAMGKEWLDQKAFTSEKRKKR